MLIFLPHPVYLMMKNVKIRDKTMDKEWINNFIQANFYINKTQYFMLGMFNNNDNPDIYKKCKKEWADNAQKAIQLMKKL